MTQESAFPGLREFWRAAVCEWLSEHGVDPHRVPADAVPCYDPAVDEWRVPVFRRGAVGGYLLNEAPDDVLRAVVRVRPRRPLPTPTSCLLDWSAQRWDPPKPGDDA